MSHPFNYKTETNRYSYYYHRLNIYYQQPVVQVSSAVLFSLSMILFFSIFAIRPTLIAISELLSKIDSQKIVLEKAEKKAASLAAAQQAYNQISTEIDQIDMAVPSDYRIQQMLLYIEATAADLHIPINNLNVNEIKFPISQSQSDPANELEFSINFEANYPEAKMLITHLSHLPRLVSIDSISLDQMDEWNRNQSLSPKAINVSLRCRIFYFRQKT